MDDKELLELAAKAVGYETLWLPDGKLHVVNEYKREGRFWNPLENDGDAFRLEIYLNITNKYQFLDLIAEENFTCSGDYYKARRRAIVRAAAEIGKQS